IPLVGMHGMASADKVAEGGTVVTSKETASHGQRLPSTPIEIHAAERRYEKLSDEAKERVLSQVKAMQDAGDLHYASQDDARVFRAFAKAGQRLAEIHVHYEQQLEFQLTKREKEGEKLDWRVTRMHLSKDKTTLIYNDFLTLSEIPKET